MQATQKAKTRKGDDPTMTSVEEKCSREPRERERERETERETKSFS